MDAAVILHRNKHLKANTRPSVDFYMTRPITSHIIEYDTVQNVTFTVNIVIYGVRCLQGNNSNNFKENTRYNIKQNDFTDNINQCIILWKNVPKKGMLFYKRSITLLLDYTYLELDKFLHDLSLEKILNYKRYIYDNNNFYKCLPI